MASTPSAGNTETRDVPVQDAKGIPGTRPQDQTTSQASLSIVGTNNQGASFAIHNRSTAFSNRVLSHRCSTSPPLPERFTSMRQDPGPTAGHLLAARIRSVVFDDLDQALVILLLKGAPEHQPRWPPWGDRISGPNLPRVRLKVDQKPLDLLAVVAQGGRAPLWRAKELLPSSAPQRVLPPPVPCRKGDGPGNGPGTAVGPSGLF